MPRRELATGGVQAAAPVKEHDRGAACALPGVSLGDEQLAFECQAVLVKLYRLLVGSDLGGWRPSRVCRASTAGRGAARGTEKED